VPVQSDLDTLAAEATGSCLHTTRASGRMETVSQVMMKVAYIVAVAVAVEACQL